MRSTGWHVMPGVGARNIEAIAKDVLKWNRLGERLPLMDAIAEDLEEQAYIASSSVVTDDSLATLSFDEIIEMLDEPQRTDVIGAYMADVALRRLTSAKNGRDFGHGKRARLTVTESGVTRRRAFIEPGHNIDLRGPGRMLLEGSVIGGKISRFSSSPEIGGRIVLDHVLHSSIIHGLVDPSNGQPRVELDILAKY